MGRWKLPAHNSAQVLAVSEEARQPQIPTPRRLGTLHKEAPGFPAPGGAGLGAFSTYSTQVWQRSVIQQGGASFKSSPANLSASQMELVATSMGVPWKLGVDSQPCHALSCQPCWVKIYVLAKFSAEHHSLVTRYLAKFTGCFKKWNDYLVLNVDHKRQS